MASNPEEHLHRFMEQCPPEAQESLDKYLQLRGDEYYETAQRFAHDSGIGATDSRYFGNLSKAVALYTLLEVMVVARKRTP